MIDIHCHILPGVDDGAIDLEDALEMARIAQGDGIKTIINTAHYSPTFEYIKGKELMDKLIEFNKELKKNNIDIEVLIGNELYYSKDLLADLEKKQFYTLNNSRYLLIEFSPMNFPKNIKDVVYELKIRGYIPVLAHVERYKEFQENPKLIREVIKEGALIQVNASSVTGKGPSVANKFCEVLLDKNMVQFIGSDAHRSNKRRPMLKEAYEYIAKTYGEERANTIFNTNPTNLINDKDIVVSIEETKEKSKKGLFAKLFRR